VRHRFHALCPYFAMFPESFVEKWITRLTKPGHVVLDPFCGRGTAPFQSLLMGRQAIASDINPVAYCVTRAKTNAPSLTQAKRRLTVLEREYCSDNWENERRPLPEFFSLAYSEETLRQILYLRSRLRWRDSNVDCIIAAVTLGALHGESRSPSYLSNQMPRTISTKPAYSMRYWLKHALRPPQRNVFGLLRRQLSFRYATQPPNGRALVLNEDIRDLPRATYAFPRPIRGVITSPPYFDTTSCEEDQWLRLWFLGGPPRPTYGLVSPDDRHHSKVAYWQLIGDMWRSLTVILDSRADVVVRIGMRNTLPSQMVKALEASAMFAGRPVKLLHHETSTITGRQTNAFRPGSTGVVTEVDCHFRMV